MKQEKLNPNYYNAYLIILEYDVTFLNIYTGCPRAQR